MTITYRHLKIFSLIFGLLLGACGLSDPPDLKRFRIISEIKNNADSLFHIDTDTYPRERACLPIGVFDSGTGGLTVLDTIAKMDTFDNVSGEKRSDGIADFSQERYIYLGDMANMPYGRYHGQGNADFLKELIIKDVQFLLGKRYYPSPSDHRFLSDKSPVKIIVIACNTATAYGFELVKNALDFWDLDLAVFGIVDAGARAAVAALAEFTPGCAFGVLATEGTCATQGYPRALQHYQAKRGRSGDSTVIQQAGFGLAAAIDGDRHFIDPKATKPRSEDQYHGPSLDHKKYKIDPQLWPCYNFEPGTGLLVETDQDGNLATVQLNSVINYIKYHVTELVHRLAASDSRVALSSVILGCTHYPFFTEAIRSHFHELRGHPRYRNYIADDLKIIDPALSLAHEVYEYLSQHDLLCSQAAEETRFFISVVNPDLACNECDATGEFTFSYKYGRAINQHRLFVKRVPMSRRSLRDDIIQRIQDTLPNLYPLIFRNDL